MTSPARRQYLDIKAQHEDALLAYQIGDFYELWQFTTMKPRQHP